MYCSQCGTKFNDNSKFCSNCGTRISLETNRKEEVFNDTILLKIKPEFHGGYLITKLIPLFIFFSFFFFILTMVFGGFIAVFADRFFYGPNLELNSLIGVSLSFLLTFVIGFITLKKRYKNAEFLFYSDRMEYIDGFFNYNKKLLYYKNIRELSMSQNVFQRKYGIGSVRLTTSGITYRNNHAYSNGVQVYDIDNIEDVYKELKRIVK